MICVVFTPSLLYPQYLLHLSRHRDQFAYGLKKAMYRLKSLKERLFVRECLRQKGLEKLYEIYKS